MRAWDPITALPIILLTNFASCFTHAPLQTTVGCAALQRAS